MFKSYSGIKTKKEPFSSCGQSKKCRHQAENIFCYVKLLLWDQDQKMLRTIFKLSKTCRHQAENIFCYVKLLLWDQDQKNVGNHFQVEVRATRHQAENIFVMSRLFWDQDHVGNHFQVLKKLKMQTSSKKYFLIYQDFSGIKTMLKEVFKKGQSKKLKAEFSTSLQNFVLRLQRK